MAWYVRHDNLETNQAGTSQTHGMRLAASCLKALGISEPVGELKAVKVRIRTGWVVVEADLHAVEVFGESYFTRG